MKNNDFIGFFDSGVGGTTVWQEVHQLLPHESTVYLADSRNAPYGKKTKEQIIELSVKNTEFLIKNYPTKLIVVACNTATVNAITHLRANYDIPFIGVEPAVKPAALQSSTKAIGVLATQGTLNSKVFGQVIETYQDVKMVTQIGHGLVDLIESGLMDTPEMTTLLHDYLQPMIAQNIDYLVLGCTHYPLLKNKIAAILPAYIQIIDSGKAIAQRVQNVLTQKDLLSSSQTTQHLFYTNHNEEVLSRLLPDIAQVSLVNF